MNGITTGDRKKVAMPLRHNDGVPIDKRYHVGRTMVNAAMVEAETEWCCAVMNARLEQYFAADDDAKKQIDIYEIAPPLCAGQTAEYARFISEYRLGFEERMLLIMAMLPHVCPSALDHFFLQNKSLGRPYTEFGGWSGKTHQGFLPTCETIAFVLAGDDLARKIAVMPLFGREHLLQRTGVLSIEYQESGEPFFCGTVRLTDEYLRRFTTGECGKPGYSSSFPAKLIASPLTWEDLVLEPHVRDAVGIIETWLAHGDRVMNEWGMARHVKPGYRCLFYGPPGTGKTLTATLLGASMGYDVYRIDLSMVVSKYIGETEKNLANVFDQAKHRRWILFFDEADALFSRRTQTSSSNDRHANQEVAYLLQRIEDCPNVVILASNLRANIDEAFMRRFQSVIYFPMPGPDQRMQLWRGLFSDRGRLSEKVDIEELAERYELSGGALINVARFASLHAIRAGREHILEEDLVEGIHQELGKEGKTV